MPSGVYIHKPNQGFQKGYKQSDEHKLKWLIANKGKIPWNKGKKTGIAPWLGKKRSKETIEKLRIASASHKEEKASNWKGDSVGYHGLHSWVIRHLGRPSTCEHCKGNFRGKHIHWANVDHSYKRNLEDWIRLCHWCHQLYDIKNNNYKLFNKNEKI